MRVVLTPGGRLVVDRKGQGRGAWLCRLGETELAEPDCIARAGRRDAFSRALRADIAAGEVELLLAMVAERARMGTVNGAVTTGGEPGHEERD